MDEDLETIEEVKEEKQEEVREAKEDIAEVEEVKDDIFEQKIDALQNSINDIYAKCESILGSITVFSEMGATIRDDEPFEEDSFAEGLEALEELKEIEDLDLTL